MHKENFKSNVMGLLENVECDSTKVLLIDCMDRVESAEELKMETFKGYSYCIQTATIRTNNKGEPYENIYFAFNKKYAKDIIGHDIEVHDNFDYDDVQIEGLREVTYGSYMNYENEIYLIAGWDSLVFDLESIDPCWYNDKEKIISYIESLNEKLKKE